MKKDEENKEWKKRRSERKIIKELNEDIHINSEVDASKFITRIKHKKVDRFGAGQRRLG